MSGFEDVLVAQSLEDAAGTVVSVLGPTSAVWSRVGDEERVLVAGQPGSGQRNRATATGICRMTIEVAGDADGVLLQAATTLLADMVDRLAVEDRARAARRRLADSERIGGLGTYTWTVGTDELEWTDGFCRILGLDPAESAPSYARLVGLLHPDDRDRARLVHETCVRTGKPFESELRIVRPSGEIRTVWSIGEAAREDDQTLELTCMCRDVTEQREAEQRVADAELRRRQALDLNDNVIQGLVTLLWQLDPDADETRQITEATLAAARHMVADLLGGSSEPDTGELVRLTPAMVEAATELTADHVVPINEPVAVTTTTGSDPGDHLVPVDVPGTRPRPTRTIEVLVADDLPALRQLLRMRLSREDDIDVVGEARDGQEAVDLVEQLRPDVVVMDLGMPVMDGLQATRRIRASTPQTRVIVLSGYPAESMAAEALAAGAECYLEKTSNLDALCTAITDGHPVADLGL